MAKKDINFEINKIKSQLRVATKYPDQWIEKYGKKGFEDWINVKLERLKYLLNLLENE